MNVTVTQPPAAGHLTRLSGGTALPNASNLNFTANQTVANLVDREGRRRRAGRRSRTPASRAGPSARCRDGARDRRRRRLLRGRRPESDLVDLRSGADPRHAHRARHSRCQPNAHDHGRSRASGRPLPPPPGYTRRRRQRHRDCADRCGPSHRLSVGRTLCRTPRTSTSPPASRAEPRE